VVAWFPWGVSAFDGLSMSARGDQSPLPAIVRAHPLSWSSAAASGLLSSSTQSAAVPSAVSIITRHSSSHPRSFFCGFIVILRVRRFGWCIRSPHVSSYVDVAPPHPTLLSVH